jgi:hypothetical protein
MTQGLAAWALGLGGAGQVAGRLCYRRLANRLGTRGRTVAVIAAGATPRRVMLQARQITPLLIVH